MTLNASDATMIRGELLSGNATDNGNQTNKLNLGRGRLGSFYRRGHFHSRFDPFYARINP